MLGVRNCKQKKLGISSSSSKQFLLMLTFFKKKIIDHPGQYSEVYCFGKEIKQSGYGQNLMIF